MPTTSLQEVAQMMVECDCGAIPVVESEQSKRPVGIITDRDIVTRIIARGEDCQSRQVSAAMTSTTISVRQDADLSEAEDLMKRHQIRRLLVVDDSEGCVGIIAQADIARHASDEETGELLEEISEPAQAW
jgi:CBS domain-containing protein